MTVPKMQMISCSIAVGGDLGQIVHRGEDNPVSFPELLILTQLHGKESIRDVKVVDEQERDSAEERARLVAQYGNAVHQVFPAEYQELPLADFRLQRLPNGKTNRPPQDQLQDDPRLGNYLRLPPEGQREDVTFDASLGAPAGVQQGAKPRDPNQTLTGEPVQPETERVLSEQTAQEQDAQHHKAKTARK